MAVYNKADFQVVEMIDLFQIYNKYNKYNGLDLGGGILYRYNSIILLYSVIVCYTELGLTETCYTVLYLLY